VVSFAICCPCIFSVWQHQQLVTTNERAATMIYNGDFYGATGELSDALAVLNQETATRASADFERIRISFDHCMLIQRCQRSIIPTGLMPSDDNVPSFFPFLDDWKYSSCSKSEPPCTRPFHIQQHTFIHYRPIKVPDKLNMDEMSDASWTTLRCVILGFNLALSCHLSAMSGADEKENSMSESSSMETTDRHSSVRHLLRRAERLY